MQLQPQSFVVRHNIELFIRALRELPKSHQMQLTKDYVAFIHRTSGTILFAIGEESHLSKRKWKPVCFRIRPDQEGVFEILEESGNDTLFQCDDLEREALKNVAETINALNEVIKASNCAKDLHSIENEISHIELATTTSLSDDPIHLAYHPVDRMSAEALLDNKPIGTYLFRKDEYAILLEEQLTQRFERSFSCLTLTVLQDEKRITDLTLVKDEAGWFWYNDDPELEEVRYPTPQAILASIKNLSLQPLFY